MITKEQLKEIIDLVPIERLHINPEIIEVRFSYRIIIYIPSLYKDTDHYFDLWRFKHYNDFKKAIEEYLNENN